jgi:hypothetical protein
VVRVPLLVNKRRPVPLLTGWIRARSSNVLAAMQTLTTAGRLDRNTGATDDIPAHPPQNHSDALVVVQRDWTGWRTATIRVRDLRGIHWSQPGGAPRPLIHASVHCDDLVSGEIAHECHLTPPPHYLVVCVLKRHTARCVFEELARRADEAGALHAPTRSRRTTAAGQLRADTSGVSSVR